MFRNDKRKIYVVICDTKIAVNKDVVEIVKLSQKSLNIPMG